jgi:hypothetical protein
MWWRRRLEDALDSRTAELIALRKAAVEHAAASPIKSAPLQSALGAWASGPSPLGSSPPHPESSTMNTRLHSLHPPPAPSLSSTESMLSR